METDIKKMTNLQRSEILKIANKICQKENSKAEFKIDLLNDEIEVLRYGYLLHIRIMIDHGITAEFGPPGVYIRKRDLDGFIIIYGELFLLSLLEEFERSQRKRMFFEKKTYKRNLKKLIHHFDLPQSDVDKFLKKHNRFIRYQNKRKLKDMYLFPDNDEINRLI